APVPAVPAVPPAPVLPAEPVLPPAPVLPPGPVLPPEPVLPPPWPPPPSISSIGRVEQARNRAQAASSANFFTSALRSNHRARNRPRLSGGTRANPRRSRCRASNFRGGPNRSRRATPRSVAPGQRRSVALQRGLHRGQVGKRDGDGEPVFQQRLGR